MSKYVYNEAEFNKKYDTYYNLVYRAAYQYLFNIEIAEDVTQEAFC